MIDDELLPIRSLNDLLFCERRCALHRIEETWVDNAHTLAGEISHKRADQPVAWQCAPGVREVHALWLKSDRLRLVGKTDVVEFRTQPGANAAGHDVPHVVRRVARYSAPTGRNISSLGQPPQVRRQIGSPSPVRAQHDRCQP